MRTQTIFVILLFVVLGGCRHTEEEVVELIRPVKYAVVSYQKSSEVRVFSGTAESEIIINLSFRSTGILTELNMKLGQEVESGELLARLDNVQARLNYESAVEQQNSSQSQMNTSKLNMDRVRSLYEKGSSSLSDYENAKNSYRTSKASYESSIRSVGLQKEQLSYGYLYAPESGFLSVVNVELDENISAGQNIGVLNAGSSIEINIGLPESIINRVEKGMSTIVTFASIEGKQFSGIISKVSPAVDQMSSTYPVKILLLDHDSSVKSGMAAEVMFDLSMTNDVSINTLTIPQQSLGEDGEGRFVFIVDAQGDSATVRKHYIKVGDLTSSGFKVISGLSEGEKIATAGLQTLLNGQKVRLID